MKELIEEIINEIDEETGAVTEIRYWLSPETSNKIAEIEKQMKALKEQEEELKQRILNEMESKNIIKLDTQDLTITYVAPTQRETLDSKLLREELPDIYDSYVKFTDVKGSIRIKVK